ncbi:MAG TPA: ATP synthase subunit I [bacterium]|nr:ATP synthase subunit I [bacterium]
MTEPVIDPDRARVIAGQEAALGRFAWLVIASGAALLIAGFWWRGLDFDVGVLLGFLIVLLNFYWTKRTVKSVLFGSQTRSLLMLSFLAKVAVTAAVLLYAILGLGVDAVGVLVGLSAIIIASVVFALIPRRARS